MYGISQYRKIPGFSLASGFSQVSITKVILLCRRNKSFAPRRERKDSGLRELVKIFCEIGFPLSFSVKFESIDFEDMGAFCCCFQVDLFESYVNPNTSITRNCPCLNCFLQSFMDLYASLFSRGGMHPIPSTVETATVMNSTTALDDSLSSVYHSPPTPLPYDADPRYFRFVKGSSHSGEESEPLRGDTEMSSEALGDGGAKWSKSDSEDGSKEVYTKGSSTFTKSKTMPGIEVYYADSDDEDICPTCLDDYTLENPKIITKCSHHFHLSCIYEWMERSETCPVCGKVMAFDENETS
ncbi:RING/U-box superfamily protein [Arabidopsis thaliana]|uniref:RING-type E3 ubiquitin transferase n=1 Tax=Arabidopsis thaliana TaxID=3702 RepID=F4KCY7_ARATH|nr:RING/U-box superfamily protein [Arabidopsis thaliana]AED94372.1 RING/U-box superfamily protein [Arabidopsis thaliana]|eukprot:NP_001190437.1 RING/U-box superfamily protein [Arabidopsis thaliana]